MGENRKTAGRHVNREQSEEEVKTTTTIHATNIQLN